MKKRLFTILLTAVMVVSVIGCGKKQTDVTTGSEPVMEETEEAAESAETEEEESEAAESKEETEAEETEAEESRTEETETEETSEEDKKDEAGKKDTSDKTKESTPSKNDKDTADGSKDNGTSAGGNKGTGNNTGNGGSTGGNNGGSTGGNNGGSTGGNNGGSTKPAVCNHTWDNGAVTKEATCKDEGVKTFTCTLCGKTKTEKIAKNNHHNWVRDDNCAYNYPATCTLRGQIGGVCSICGGICSDFIILDPLGHLDEGKKSYDVPGAYQPTCGDKGHVAVICSRCGVDLRFEDVPATGNHSWTFAGTYEQFDEDANRYLVDMYECSVCKYYEYRNRRLADD